MPDLQTTYLGLTLKNPLVLAASPLTKRVETAVALEHAGVAAIVMHSLFEEAIEHAAAERERTFARGAESFAEATSYLPDLDYELPTPDEHLELVKRIRRNVRIPLIGSLNGTSPGGWIDYAKKLQDCGINALELNVYYLSADPLRSSGEIEDDYLTLVASVRSAVQIPLAVKIGPSFTGLPQFCRRLADAGSDGIVLFNRFYQPDIDLENLEVIPALRLSTSDDLLLPLRWTAILRGKVDADLAVTSGVHTSSDALKALMAGAACVQVAAAFMQHGAHFAGVLLDGMKRWMEEHSYDSIRQLTGSMSHAAVADPTAFERANYLKALRTYDDRLP